MRLKEFAVWALFLLAVGLVCHHSILSYKQYERTHLIHTFTYKSLAVFIEDRDNEIKRLSCDKVNVIVHFNQDTLYFTDSGKNLGFKVQSKPNPYTFVSIDERGNECKIIMQKLKSGANCLYYYQHGYVLFFSTEDKCFDLNEK